MVDWSRCGLWSKIFRLCVPCWESPVEPAPLQGKAIGGSSNTPIAAATVNAIYAAVGMRLHELPFLAERTYAALQAHKKKR